MWNFKAQTFLLYKKFNITEFLWLHLRTWNSRQYLAIIISCYRGNLVISRVLYTLYPTPTPRHSYSNVRVVRSITRFNGARLSYALVCSNCNKLVITWPLGCLANLSPSGALRPQVINQPAPSWPCTACRRTTISTNSKSTWSKKHTVIKHS